MKRSFVLLAVCCICMNNCGGGAQDATVELLAAGDVAQCSAAPISPLSSTAQLTALQAESETLKHLPILAIGDLAYYSGTADEFSRCYDPTWGRLKSRTYPVPGNHEYGTPNAQGYKDYFGSQATPAGKTYYSFNLGAWHIVALDSNIDMSSQSPQAQWLRKDLEKYKNKPCTLAYWHHPRFASAIAHSSNPVSQPVWEVLNEYHADIVLAGHNHHYERFEPLDSAGQINPNGITSFVVGTGGASLYRFGAPTLGSLVRLDSDYGFLKLTLKPESYRWEFLSSQLTAPIDSGERTCRSRS